MSRTDESFEAIRGALQSLWTQAELQNVEVDTTSGMLLLRLPSDIAGFAVCNGDPGRECAAAYDNFKRLYRENSRAWDERTLSFVVCRSSEHAEDDRFYAALEADPLFCRKYVIRAHETILAQREELLRLPFLPIPIGPATELSRPQSAQDLLQSAGVSASFARQLIEAGHRGADRIALDLRNGREPLPATLIQPRRDRLTVTTPRSTSRLVSLTIEGFRTYREAKTFDLDASVIVLYGPNGLGKTSVFDAIDYASTGRIGRLCRTRRSQSEFARIATHLDKAPGSGSVALTVRDDGPERHSWRIQRSTGDWGTAWIDGEEADRKTVINKLTQADWLESTPRQQTLESLFRATHLFGQDEQELLMEFRKASVIPEAFISEMLALQDYSQGLTKVEAVLAKLSGHRDEIEQELAALRNDSGGLAASLADFDPADGAEQTPIELSIAELREGILSSGAGLQSPPEVAEARAYAEWYDVAVAESDSLNERIQLSQTLRNDLPTHHARVREHAKWQLELTEIDRELAGIEGEEQTLARRKEASGKALTEAHAISGQLQAKRAAVRSAVEAFASRRELSRQIVTVTDERNRQLRERSDVDARLATSEATLSKALSDSAEADRVLLSTQEDSANVQRLINELPQVAETASLLSGIEKEIATATETLREANKRQGDASKAAEAATRARERREPEYQRALETQAELDTLLDSIQRHVHAQSCPLCGSAFESAEALLASIGRQRGSESEYGDVTKSYQSLLTSEKAAADRLRVTTIEVSSASAAIAELSARQEEANRRLAEFRTRLEDDPVVSTDIADVRKTLLRRQEEVGELLVSRKAAAEAARRHLQTVRTSHTEESARRKVIQERVAELDRRIRELTDQTVSLDAKIMEVLPGVQDVEVGLSAEAEANESAHNNVLAMIQELQAKAKSDEEARQVVDDRKQALTETRERLAADLALAFQSISAFRQRLRTLDIPDDADANGLAVVARRDSERVDAIGVAVASGLVILNALRARERRAHLLETRRQLEELGTRIGAGEQQLRQVQEASTVCSSIEALLKRERQRAIEKHIAAYGPMITMIQQRLRSVYGFGGVQLEARGGEARVKVEWRSKSVQVPPTDFFSDSQKQILMLSIFMAGSLRQNWSGFASVLLDDPVTHFDDLNAYAFVELMRGIVATSPNEWQFIVSTCEQRLFDLMQKKFSRLPSGAVFYEFLGMTDTGPIVERR